jgi:cleavage stimulation factor subunit 2
MHVPTPPVHNQPYQPPPIQQPPPQQGQNQEELIKQVMALSPQQIDALPPADRAQVMALRQQLRGY